MFFWSFIRFYKYSTIFVSMSNKIIIAIDGFSSTGKSTFARAVAAMVGYAFIDTGAMYRAVTLHAIENRATTDRQVVGLLDDCRIEFRFNPARGASDTFLNGRNVEALIRSIEVSERVSVISAIPEVRARLTGQQQRMGLGKGIVMDGRDIGTAVFPQAELKVFMIADLDVRIKRRYDELRGKQVSLWQVEQNLLERDHIDQTRATNPLRQAPDALVLDNSRMSLEEELEWIKEPLRRLGVL